MIPEEILRLAAERDEARRARDFERADRLRETIRGAGFDCVDGPNGTELRPLAPPEEADPLRVRRTHDASVQWVVQGWPEDVERGIASFRRFHGGWSVQHIVVNAAGLERTWPEDVDVTTIDPTRGWAAARNAALARAAGRIVVVVDGSIEAIGDVIGPLEEAFDDASVGVCGPFGIVSDDLREFRESDGPEVDAIEGYLMAFRRELVEEGLRFDEKFRFYRTADIELSFQIKAMGLRAVVTPLPVERHEHRMWNATAEDERQRLSKRNFYRFLEKWRGRSDLLVSVPPDEWML
jgi:cysteinyl-tRNA synthetase